LVWMRPSGVKSRVATAPIGCEMNEVRVVVMV
jgi:hypothetical protein